MFPGATLPPALPSSLLLFLVLLSSSLAGSDLFVVKKWIRLLCFLLLPPATSEDYLSTLSRFSNPPPTFGSIVHVLLQRKLLLVSLNFLFTLSLVLSYPLSFWFPLCHCLPAWCLASANLPPSPFRALAFLPRSRALSLSLFYSRKFWARGPRALIP